MERLQKQKDEEEEAIQMSQMPLSKKRINGIRSHAHFMEDQIKYEQKRYENLKKAIVKEEENEQYLF